MTTEIIVNEKYKLLDDGNQYELMVFDEGGKEVRIPKTGELTLTKPQWRKAQLYFQTLHGACKRIARMEASSGGTVEIQEYIKRLEDWENSIAKSLGIR